MLAASVSEAGHLLWREAPEDEEKVNAEQTDHFYSTHNVSTWLQSAPSVTRRCISVSNGRFISFHLLKLVLGRDGDPAREPKDIPDRGSILWDNLSPSVCNAVVR